MATQTTKARKQNAFDFPLSSAETPDVSSFSFLYFFGLFPDPPFVDLLVVLDARESMACVGNCVGSSWKQPAMTLSKNRFCGGSSHKVCFLGQRTWSTLSVSGAPESLTLFPRGNFVTRASIGVNGKSDHSDLSGSDNGSAKDSGEIFRNLNFNVVRCS